MNRPLAAAAAATLLAAGPAPAAPAPEGAVTRIAAAPARDGWFVCDGIAGPYAVFAGKPDAAGASLITVLDRRTGRFDTQPYQVGPADPGAGQIYWALSQGGNPAGNVHGVNPGMIEGGTATPAIASVDLAGLRLECRLLARTRFIGVNSRRSIVITEGAQGLIYQSFDYRKRGAPTRPDGVQRSNVPTLKVGGGVAIGPDPAGFRFANGGFTYMVAWPAAGGAAATRVTRGGLQLGVDRLVGFSAAPPAPAAAKAAALGPDAVWSGKDLDTCRAGRAADIEYCLVTKMRHGGATAASIALTQRLIAKDNPGYISAWKQAGPIGIATVTYPFRANTNQGTMLIPAGGEPIDADGYDLTAADKARADYRAAQAQHPAAFPVPPGDVAVKPGADGSMRVLVTTATADCHACAPNGSIVVAYDFDAAGRLVKAGLVMAA